MTQGHNGKIALDIRDSVADWTPYLPPKAPEGAPNVLYIAWDDVGYGTMDVFGGPVETPNMRRVADMGVRFSNFHTTALCSPTRSSLLTGRNATSNGMATIAEFSSGFPGISTRIPFENGFISEVLVERGYNTYCVGKWHLTPGEECNLAAYKGRWPLGRGFERFYGFLGGESNQWYPDLVQDNSQIDAPGTPEDGYHLSKDLADQAIGMIQAAKVIDPDKPFFMYLAPGAGHAPHHVFEEWADKYKGKFDQGYEAIREGILARQKKLGLLPDDTELSPINPHGEPARTGPDGQPWPLLDTVRPWDSLNDDERRLFARMAEVFAGFVSYTDDQLGRVLDYLEESGQLDNTLVVVVSDNGASGEGGPNGSFNEWRFFNGVADTTEIDASPHRRARHAAVVQPLLHGLGVGVRHAVPVLEAVGGLRGWRRRHVPGRVAEADQSVRRGAPSVHPRGRRRPDGVRPPRHRATRGDQGLHAEPDRGRELRGGAHRPEGARQADAVLRHARAALDLPRRVAGLHRAPTHLRVGQVRAGRVGALRPRTRPLTVEERRRRRASTPRNAQEPLVLLRRDLQRVAARRPLSTRADARRTSPRSTGPSAVHLLPACRRCPRGGRCRDQRPVVHDRCGRRDRLRRRQGVLYAHGGVAGGHSLYVKDKKLRYTFNWLGTKIYDIVADTEISPGTHVFTAEFASKGQNTDPTMPGFAGTLTLYVDTKKVGEGEIVTQPGNFCLVGDGICIGRDSASPVTPEYTAPFAFTGGTIDKVVVDVSGEKFVDHEAQVAAWFSKD